MLIKVYDDEKLVYETDDAIKAVIFQAFYSNEQIEFDASKVERIIKVIYNYYTGSLMTVTLGEMCDFFVDHYDQADEFLAMDFKTLRDFLNDNASGMSEEEVFDEWKGLK